MLPYRFQREIVALAFPAWRHEDGRMDTRCIHLTQQLVLAQWHGPVRSLALGPWTLRGIGTPDVDLRINNLHAVFPVDDVL